MKAEIYKLIPELKKRYENNENIIDFLKRKFNRDKNTIEDILVSYDLQAGSYVRFAESNSDYLDRYTSSIASVINGLGRFNSILEPGVGEATTFSNVLKKVNGYDVAYGLDISWSRIKYATDYAAANNVGNASLFTGDIFNLPFKDSSIDLLYTSHALEPNGGKEEELLKELLRVTRKYLVLFEPAFDFASQEGKDRMTRNGYVTRLFDVITEMKLDVKEHRLLDVYANPLNPTGVTVIEKNIMEKTHASELCCPLTKGQMEKRGDSFYCESSGLSYPIIDGIPCLLSQNAILTIHR